MVKQINSLELELQKHIQEAIETSNKAVSDYYNYQVCAMIIDEDGNKYKGINFEPANGKSICAETGAISSYFLSDRKKIKYIVVYGSPMKNAKKENTFCYPCGTCRQNLNDFFSGDIVIYAVNETATKVDVVTISELLPHAYSKENLW